MAVDVPGSGGSVAVGRVPERPGFFSRHKVGIITALILSLVAEGGAWYYFKVRNAESEPVADVAAPAERQRSAQTTAGTTKPETEIVPLYGDANYKSENFQVGEIAIGGEAEFLLSEDSPGPLEITGIRGEAFTEKNKQEVKLLVSWKTNKLALSEVNFSKGAGQAKKTLEEEDYSLSHSLVLPGLDQASTYIYTITSRDRYGNEVESEPHAVYTGTRTVSLFELIANAVGEVFGWAVKK